MGREVDRMVLEGYSLTTARIRYWMPDHPSILAPEFIWQDWDLEPEFPALRRFLRFWTSSLEGRLHSVEVASRRLIRPAEFAVVGATFSIN